MSYCKQKTHSGQRLSHKSRCNDAVEIEATDIDSNQLAMALTSKRSCWHSDHCGLERWIPCHCLSAKKEDAGLSMNKWELGYYVIIKRGRIIKKYLLASW